MLVLSRFEGELICIGKEIRITVLDLARTNGDEVLLKIEAPAKMALRSLMTKADELAEKKLAGKQRATDCKGKGARVWPRSKYHLTWRSRKGSGRDGGAK